MYEVGVFNNSAMEFGIIFFLNFIAILYELIVYNLLPIINPLQ